MRLCASCGTGTDESQDELCDECFATMPEDRWTSYNDIERDPRPTWRELAGAVAGVLAVALAFAFLRPIVALMLDLAEAIGIDS